MLDVLFNQQLVGKLNTIDRILSFEYDKNWLIQPAAFPLSPRLPLTPEVFKGEEVAYFFSNLLPEGPLLNAILKLKKLPAGDIYAQLEVLGEESAGAFSIVNERVIKKRHPHYKPYLVDDLHTDIKTIGNKLPLQLQHNQLRLSLAGAQDKLPVKYEDNHFWLPVDGAASTHIIKPQIIPAAAFPDSVWNEAFCLRLAKLVGLNSVNAEVLNIPEPILIVERFDRKYINNTIQRLHQLDFCQLGGFLPDQKYEKYHGPSFNTLFTLIDQYAHVPARERLQALNWLIFNFIIGNADAHAKNIAMLIMPEGKMRLAPFYDILSTAIYPSLGEEMAMKIGGEDRPRWITQQHWQQLASDIGINFTLMKKQALLLAKEIHSNIEKAATILGISSTHRIVKNIKKVIVDRTRKLEASL